MTMGRFHEARLYDAKAVEREKRFFEVQGGRVLLLLPLLDIWALSAVLVSAKISLRSTQGVLRYKLVERV